MKTPLQDGLRIAALSLALVLPQAFAQEMDGDMMDMDTPEPLSPGQEHVIDKIMSEFEDFAGSQENADALVRGLRTGSDINLSDPDGMDGMDGAGEVTIENETAYGFGNVSHILTLAEAQLNDLGIEDPTPEQIQAALLGGEIDLGDMQDPEMVSGILYMREELGMGWGEIAQELGFKLGHLKSAKKRPGDGDGTENGSSSFGAAATDNPGQGAGKSEGAGSGKPENVGLTKVEKGNKPDFDKPAKPQRPDKPQKPEKVAKPERPPKPEKPDRPGRS